MTITYNNLTLTDIGNAYLDYDTTRGSYYTVLATDNLGDTYRLIWLVDDVALAIDNADECCDWSQPDYVELQAD